VKHPVPRSIRRSLRLRRTSTRRKPRQRAGNARGASAHDSYGWQTSVGRIARLLHQEAARPVGEHERALAGRKFVAPPDAGRGWVEGETVRVCTVPNKFPYSRPAGFGLQVLDTMKGVLGQMPVLLSPAGRRRSPLAHGFKFASLGLRGSATTDSASGGHRIPTRACLRVTKRTSEVDATR